MLHTSEKSTDLFVVNITKENMADEIAWARSSNSSPKKLFIRPLSISVVRRL